jgi:hypothetical protein
MQRTAVLVFLAAVLLSSGLAGCHLSSNPTPTPSPSPTVTLPPGQEPVEIVSVTGPIKPINPGGPTVEITVKNVSTEPVIALEATLEVSSAAGRPFVYKFNVALVYPLKPGSATSAVQNLITGGFSDSTPYPVTIKGMLLSGAAFQYTKTVMITAPPE